MLPLREGKVTECSRTKHLKNVVLIQKSHYIPLQLAAATPPRTDKKL